MQAMLEALIPVFLARDVGASFEMKSLRRAIQVGDGSIAWQAVAHGGRYKVGCSTVSADPDSAIFAALRGVYFEPIEADCACDSPDGMPGWISDDCPCHEWQRRVELASQEQG